MCIVLLGLHLDQMKYFSGWKLWIHGLRSVSGTNNFKYLSSHFQTDEFKNWAILWSNSLTMLEKYLQNSHHFGIFQMKHDNNLFC